MKRPVALHRLEGCSNVTVGGLWTQAKAGAQQAMLSDDMFDAQGRKLGEAVSSYT